MNGQIALFGGLVEVRAPVRPISRRPARKNVPAPVQTVIEVPPQRRVERESKAIYWSVVRLRNRGIEVYRHGQTQHKVGGKIMTNQQLRDYARRMLAKEGM